MKGNHIETKNSSVIGKKAWKSGEMKKVGRKEKRKRKREKEIAKNVTQEERRNHTKEPQKHRSCGEKMRIQKEKTGRKTKKTRNHL